MKNLKNLFVYDEDLSEQVDADHAWILEGKLATYEIFQDGDTFEVYVDGEFECQTDSFERAVTLALPMIGNEY